MAQALQAIMLPQVGRQRRVGPVGVDVGVDVIHLCQLRPHDERRYTVTGSVGIPFTGSRAVLLDSPARFKKILRDGMRRQGFVGRKAVAAMPADLVRFTPITYRADGHHADEVILKMVSGRIDGDITDYVVDYLPVRAAPEQEESLALAAVARRDDVLHYLDALTGAGLEVEALDIGPAAIRRLLSVLYTGDDEEGETILVVNTGAEKTYLSVVSGRRLLFDQPVDFGERGLLSHLVKVLELNEEECRALVMRHGLDKAPHAAATTEDAEIAATLLEILKNDFVRLVDEINRILIFTAAETRGRPLGRVCLLGGIARWPGAESLLRELIDVPAVDTQRDIADFFVVENQQGIVASSLMPEMAVAAGLALRGLIGRG
jgi:Tfp pilus assembly PilM family ATPase